MKFFYKFYFFLNTYFRNKKKMEYIKIKEKNNSLYSDIEVDLDIGFEFE